MAHMSTTKISFTESYTKYFDNVVELIFYKKIFRDSYAKH